jgi:hypothetical protein
LVFSYAIYNIPNEEILDQIISISNIAFAVIVLKISFMARKILIDNFSQDKDFNVSGVATFFFTIYYLQYKINRL